MRTLLATAILLPIVLASPAGAQIDPDPDGIGVYLDPCGCNYCCPLQPGPYRAYLAITRATSTGGVGGWECRLPVDGPALVTSWSPRGFAINIMTPPEFMVGLGYALPWWPTIILMDIEFTLLETTTPLEFYIKPLVNPAHQSIPGNVCYADGDDVNILKPLQLSTGSFDIPVLVVNGDCPTGAQDSSWGGVKAMFR